MRAIVRDRYGSPDVLTLADVEVPTLGDHQILVRVHASSVNHLDLHAMRGEPYIIRQSSGLRKPKVAGLGSDVAGTVEAVGAAVTHVSPGQRVFGISIRTFAEYVRTSKDAVVPMPSNLTPPQAAAVPVAATTALQALQATQAGPGTAILINGAAGGVGTFAVQIAKHLGAEVTAVSSSRNGELLHSLGADAVIDRTAHDFTRTRRRYDIIIDTVANRPLRDLKRALGPDGEAVIVGAGAGHWIGPLGVGLMARLASVRRAQRFSMFMSQRSAKDLLTIKALVESRAITPVIDRCYPLDRTADALRYLERRAARGKVVIDIDAIKT